MEASKLKKQGVGRRDFPQIADNFGAAKGDTKGVGAGDGE